MRTLFLFFCIISIAPCWAQELPDDVMPFSDVRVGMSGYLLTTFRGTEPLRVPLRVVAFDLVRGTFPNIYVELTDVTVLRGDVPDENLVMGGMSGSPVYLEGRLFGLVHSSYTDVSRSHAWITPAEYLLAHPPILDDDESTILRNAPVPDVLEPGAAFVSCSVWGDVTNCLNATVAYRMAGNRWYAQGHGSRPLEQTGIERGRTAAPIWRGLVRAHYLGPKRSGLITERVGEMIGVSLWDSTFGIIIATDRLPRLVTVNVTHEGFSAKPIVSSFQTMHSWFASNRIVNGFRVLNERYVSKDECTWVHATIRLAGIDEAIVLRDIGENFSRPQGHSALNRMMLWLFQNAYDKPIVQEVSLTVTRAGTNRRDSCGLFEATGANIERLRGTGETVLDLMVLRDPDSRMLLKRFALDRELPRMMYPSLYVHDGMQLQHMILSQLPLRDAISLLNEYPERAGLYLLFFPPTSKAPPAAGDGVPDGWSVVNRGIKVFQMFDTGGVPAFVRKNSGVQLH